MMVSQLHLLVRLHEHFLTIYHWGSRLCRCKARLSTTMKIDDEDHQTLRVSPIFRGHYSCGYGITKG